VEWLKPKQSKKNIYNNSGIYKLACQDSSKTYVGQTGCIFKARYTEHIQAIKTKTFWNMHNIFWIADTHSYGKYNENPTSGYLRQAYKHPQKVLHLQNH
jgi:hypothetical protein